MMSEMKVMTYGSVCSGIEAASVAWESLGWQADWLAEIEPFPSAVLAHRFPSVPNLGDMTCIADQVANDNVPAPDVLVGGTPCQAFSVAGARKGLADERGFLTIKFVELANAIDQKRAANDNQPAIIVWENVPGVLSDKGNAFGAFLGLLSGEDVELQPAGKKWTDAGCVYGPQRTVAWRVLDAQYFGLAQRRRRVFVVASARAGFSPAAVFFERDGSRRDTAPSREAGQGAAGGSGAGFEGCWWDGGQVSQTLDAVLYKKQTMPEKNRFPAVIDGGLLRFITPTEAERLQGFPDGWTAIPWRGKPANQCPDGPRYKALGNSMAVPCMAWIGRRIADQLAIQATPLPTNDNAPQPQALAS